MDGECETTGLPTRNHWQANARPPAGVSENMDLCFQDHRLAFPSMMLRVSESTDFVFSRALSGGGRAVASVWSVCGEGGHGCGKKEGGAPLRVRLLEDDGGRGCAPM